MNQDEVFDLGKREGQPPYRFTSIRGMVEFIERLNVHVSELREDNLRLRNDVDRLNRIYSRPNHKGAA